MKCIMQRVFNFLHFRLKGKFVEKFLLKLTDLTKSLLGTCSTGKLLSCEKKPLKCQFN